MRGWTLGERVGVRGRRVPMATGSNHGRCRRGLGGAAASIEATRHTFDVRMDWTRELDTLPPGSLGGAGGVVADVSAPMVDAYHAKRQGTHAVATGVPVDRA